MMAQQLKELLQANYAVEVVQVFPVTRDLFRVETKEGLRRLTRVRKKPSRLIFAYSAVSVLRERGFDQMLKIELTRDGEAYFQAENSYWVMMNWVDGRVPELERLSDVEQITRDLAKLHHVLSGILPINGEVSGKEWSKWPERLTQGQKHWQSYLRKIKPENLSDFDQMALEKKDWLQMRIDRAAELASSLYCQKAMQTERDLMALAYSQMKEKHFLLGFDGRVYFVDPFDVRYSLRVRDLARWMKRVAKNFPEHAEVILKVMHWYEEERPLSVGERQMLLADLVFPAGLLKVIKRYSERKKRWPEEGYTRKLRRTLRSSLREFELYQTLASEFAVEEGE